MSRPYKKTVTVEGMRKSRGAALQRTRAERITDRPRGQGQRLSVRAAAYGAALAAQETKYFDCGINTSVTWSGADWASSEVPCDNYVNSSGSPAAYTDSALIPSANGSGYGQVSGTKYKLKALRVRGHISAASLAGQGPPLPGPITVRVMLVHDLMPNGAQAQGEDILQDVGVAAENLFAFLRIPNGLGKYKILKDELVTLQPAAAVLETVAQTQNMAWQDHQFSFTCKWPQGHDVMIKANNATPAIAGLINCNMFLLVAAVSQTGGSTFAAQAINIVAASRAYYVD